MNRTILIVGNDLDLLKALSDVLEMAGFKVFQQVGFDTVIEAARENSLDLIILDDSVNDLKFLHFLNHWKSSYSLNAIPILLLTADQRDELKLRAIDRFVKVPGPTDAILRAITGFFNSESNGNPIL